MSAKTIRFDQSKCTACCACAMACMDEKDTDVEQGERALRQVYTEEGCRDGQVSFRFHSDSCLHCRVPACAAACTAGCLYKDAESGLVIYNTAACDGCGQCLNACRMGAISLNRHGKIQKCDGCIERQRVGKIPACVLVCPTGALYLRE